MRRRLAHGSEQGQTAIVLVVTFSVLASLVGVVLVQTVINSNPLLQAKAVQIYAHRALEAGQNAYLTAVNANPSLAQCNTNTNNSGTCSGLDYGQWNAVNSSNSDGADQEYYAFGNPQPTFDGTTNALTSLSVQVVGAAYDPSATNNYLFDQETFSITPANGFLSNVWWSNYESYSDTGDYSTCNYNWKLGYNISNQNVSCSPVYFGPQDYLFGPVYTNDSVFVSPSPSFGTPSSPSTVTTADPNCLFVDANHGMSGSSTNCSSANSDVATYNTTTSSSGHTVASPPANDAQLGIIASHNGCLYSGPTQITLSTAANGTGQMTVVSPDTVEGTQTINGTTYTWDTNNITSNVNNCPNNGTAPLPSNGVLFVQNNTSPNKNNIASPTQPWANPFDDPTYNTVTNLTSSPSSPQAGQAVALTATVTSGSNQISSGATVAFKQTTRSSGVTSTTTISQCSAQPLRAPVAVTPATTPPTYTATAVCPTSGTFNESSRGTGAFTAVYSGGSSTTTSQASLEQTNNYTQTINYGPDAQVTAGGCTSCYYGQTSTPDTEGDAFVNGSLSGQLTIGTANNVIIDGSITYADCNWTTGQSGSSAPSQGLCPYNLAGINDGLGLIANNYVEVNRPVIASSTQGNNNTTIEPYCGATPAATCDPSDGTDGITIDAAVLALTQSFVVNNFDQSGTEGPLNVYGSIQQYARGPVGTFNGSSLLSGYVKHYTWDPLLNFVSPPSYLVPSTPSWVLASVTNNAGNASRSVCPPLSGFYAGTSNGAIVDGPPITQYCTAANGLPNFPSQTAPSQPTGISASASLSGIVTLNWTDPQTNNGSAIQQYAISSNPPCPTCTFSSLTGANVTTATVSGLTAGTAYNFTVSAINGVGASSPSTASNAVTIPAVPSAPTLASASTNTNGSITVNWTDPTDNGAAITRYNIVPSPACGSCTYTTLTGATLTSATVSGVTPGANYSFTVTATNGVGTGPASSASNTVTAPNVPGTPTIGTATFGNTSASVSWTAPAANGSPITGYSVTPYLNGTTAQAAQIFVSTATTQTVTGLTNGSAYTFKVAAINGVGTGSLSGASNSCTPATTPGAPTIGTATRGNTSAVVTWTAPSSNGGAAITGYTVTPYLNGTTAQTAQVFASTTTTQTITGLTNGSAYTFKVAATNSVGTGTQSAATGSITPATTPGVPTGVGGSKGSASGSVNLSWTAPSSTGGSAITGYTVTPYLNGTTAQTARVFSTSATSQTITGLNTASNYTFVVAATNAVGTGSQSTASATIQSR